MRQRWRSPVVFATLFFVVPSARASAQRTACVAAPAAAASRTPRALRARVVAAGQSAPLVDGRLDDAAWNGGDVSSDFFQYEPAPLACATERTEVRVVMDAQALYVGMRMFDSRPDSIRSQFLRRDDGGASADWAAVIVDSYHDRRTAYRFAATPRGTRTDVLHLNDIAVDSTWDAVWEVATSVDAEGWTAEFRIPLSQLRYSTNGDHVWGLNFSRTIGRRSETSYWAPVIPADGRFVSLMGELRDVEVNAGSHPIELLPYTVGKLNSDPTATSNPLTGHRVSSGSAGLDLKYGLTSNFTLTATINPDFGQVDADPSVVNLGAFETFYPERRPFFTEGTQLFTFPLVPEGFAFYSRRIGRSPQVSAKVPPGGYSDVPGTATILGAAKITGKTAGGTSVGLITAVTDEADARLINGAGVESSQPVEPTSRYAVGRLSRDFRRGRSGLGLLTTFANRDADDVWFGALRTSAVGGGFNGFHRFGRDRYQLTGWLFSSQVSGNASALAATQRSSVHYWQRPDAEGYSLDTTITSMAGGAGEGFIARIGGSRLTWQAGGGFRSPGFEVNDVGYVSYTDVWYWSVTSRYRVTKPRGAARDWWVEGQQVTAHTFGGQIIRPSFHLSGNALFSSFWSIVPNIERWNTHIWPWELRGGPGLRRSGYTNVNVTVNSDSRKSWRLRPHIRLQISDELGGYTATVDPSISFRPTSRTNVTMTPSWTRNEAPAQYVAAATATGGVRQYMVGHLEQTTMSLTGRVSHAINSTMTLDVYAQPFISGNSFDEFRRVVDSHALDVDARFPLVGNALSYTQSTNRYAVDTDGNGTADFTFANPDFSVRTLRTNTVLRWEFRQGSTAYFVWSQARDDGIARPFSISGDTRYLFAAQPKNVVMIKVAYWLDR